MSNKLIKHNEESKAKRNEHIEFYNTIGKIYIACGLASFLLLAFVSFLPQDYEKYNVPFWFGMWALISLALILIGITPIILGRYSKKYQVWVEKEVNSFCRKNVERALKELEKNEKK